MPDFEKLAQQSIIGSVKKAEPLNFEEIAEKGINAYFPSEKTSNIYQGDINEFDNKYIPYGGFDALRAERARNQSTGEQLGKTVGNLVPNIGLGIIENIGYLGELPTLLTDKPADFSNSLTEFARKNRNKLFGEVYRENPEQVFDVADPAWWLEHGGGLAESIGEFAVTGAGVGSITKGLAKKILPQAFAEGASTLTTAGALAYTEGAMSGNEIYKRTYDEHLIKYPNDILGAKKIASQAAAETVKLNTSINTLLNVSGIMPLFKSAKNIRKASDLPVNLKSAKNLDDYITKVNAYKEALAIEKPEVFKTLAREGVFEALEEEVNLFAERRGEVKGGLRPDEDWTTSLKEAVFSQEGALSGILGAVGGIGQTGIVSYAPMTKDADGNLTNNDKKAREQEYANKVKFTESIVESVSQIKSSKDKLEAIARSGDPYLISQAKDELFSSMAKYHADKNTLDIFEKMFEDISKVSNQDIGDVIQRDIDKLEEELNQLEIQKETVQEDEQALTLLQEQKNQLVQNIEQLEQKRDQAAGKSEAMLLGYTDSLEDNSYREEASKRVSQIDQYKNLLEQYQKEYNTTEEATKARVGEEVLRRYINLNNKEQSFANATQALNDYESTIAIGLDAKPRIGLRGKINALDSMIKSGEYKGKKLKSLEKERNELQKQFDDELPVTFKDKKNRIRSEEIEKRYWNLKRTELEFDEAREDFNDLRAKENRESFVEKHIKDVNRIIEKRKTEESKRKAVKEKTVSDLQKYYNTIKPNLEKGLTPEQKLKLPEIEKTFGNVEDVERTIFMLTALNDAALQNIEDQKKAEKENEKAPKESVKQEEPQDVPPLSSSEDVSDTEPPLPPSSIEGLDVQDEPIIDTEEEYVDSDKSTQSSYTIAYKERGNADTEYLDKEQIKIINAGSALAVRVKDYRINEKGVKVTISNEFQSGYNPVLMTGQIKVGDDLILQEDYEYNDSVNTYESLIEEENRTGQIGMFRPIKVIRNDETIGYLHDINYINPNNVVEELIIAGNVIDNIRIQKERLKSLRNNVISNEGRIEAKISALQGETVVSVNAERERRPTSEAIKNTEIQLGVVTPEGIKRGGRLIPVDNNEEFFESPKNGGRVGSTVLLLPKPNSKTFQAFPLSVNKVQEVDLLMNIFEDYLLGTNKVADQFSEFGFYLNDRDSVQELISQYVYLHNLSREEQAAIIEDAKEVGAGRKYLSVTKDNIWIMDSGGTGATTINRTNWNQRKDKLKEHLSKMYYNIQESKFDDTFRTYRVNEEGQVEEVELNYDDYIKEITTTIVHENVFNYDSRNYVSYFDNPNIEITPTTVTKHVEKATEEEIKPSEPEEDSDDDFNGNELFPVMSPATYSREQLKELETQTIIPLFGNEDIYKTYNLLNENGKIKIVPYKTDDQKIKTNAWVNTLNESPYYTFKVKHTKADYSEYRIFIYRKQFALFQPLVTNEVQYNLKAINLLSSDKGKQIFEKGQKNNWNLNKILTELQVPKEQKQLILDKNINDREEIITSLLADNSFVVEINTATKEKGSVIHPDLGEVDNTGDTSLENTQYYSNLTVPGGTNYTENEIATPAILPAIKGHAEFSTDNGIGWFRSDDYRRPNELGSLLLTNKDTKNRRILEVQSDLFQKGRDIKMLVGSQQYDGEQWLDDSFQRESPYETPKINSNQFLQLLNKDNNWVTFFVKSIVQDSAKKGYEKVLFPLGKTSLEIEGFRNIDNFIEIKENRIKQLEEAQKIYINPVIITEGNLLSGRKYKIKNDLSYNTYNSIEELKTDAIEIIKSQNNEISQIKEEIKRVNEEGLGASFPIYNFYEKTITNILNKQGYNPIKITDEYGNKWNEVSLLNIDISISFQPSKNILLSDLQKALDKDTPKGISVEEINDIINHFTASTLNDFYRYQSVAGNNKYDIEESFAKIRATLETNDSSTAKVILANLPLIKESVINRLKAINFIQTKFTEYEDEATGESISFEQVWWNDDSGFQVDNKFRASQKIKRLILLTKDLDESGKPKISNLGFTKYLEIDQAFNDLKRLLADIEPDFNLMKEKMESLVTDFPWIRDVLDKFDESGNYKNIYNTASLEDLKNDFVVTMSNSVYSSNTLLYRIKEGATTSYLLETNQNSTRLLLKSLWIENFKNSPLVTVDEDDNIVIDEEKRKELLQWYSDNITKNRNFIPNQEDLDYFLNSLSIKLSQKAKTKLLTENINKLSPKSQWTSRYGIFSAMQRRLEGKDNENRSEFERFNPLFNNSGVNKLARLEAYLQKQIQSNSYINGRGDQINLVNQQREITIRHNFLLNNKEYVKRLLNVPFLKSNGNNTWLQQIADENTEFLESFDINIIDTLRQDGTVLDGKKPTEFTARQIEGANLVSFDNQSSKKDTYLNWYVPSKSVVFQVKVPKLEVKVNASNQPVGNSLDALYNIVQSEINRIRDSNVEVQGYNPKAFYFFKSFNTLKYKNALGEEVSLLTDGVVSESKEAQDAIKAELQKIFAKIVSDKKKVLTEQGIITKDGIQFVNKKFENQEEIDRYIAQYEFNYILGNFNMYQTYIGDPALFNKGSFEKTADNISKRLTKDLTSGLRIPTDKNVNEIYLQVAFEDQKVISRNLVQIREILGEDAEKYNGDKESTDAQEYVTYNEGLFILKQIGYITKNDYNSLKDKLDSGKKLSDSEIEKIKPGLFGITKPVATNKRLVDGQVEAIDYVKSSAFILLPQLTAGLPIDKVRASLELLEKEESEKRGKATLVRGSYASANKLGGGKPINIFNEPLIGKDNYVEMNRRHFRLQTEIPYDPNKSKNTDGTQRRKLIQILLNDLLEFDYDGKKVKGSELKQAYNKTYNDLFKSKFDSFKEELIDDQGFLKKEEIQRVLQDEAVRRNWNRRDIEALQVYDDSGNFVFPLQFHPNNEKIESLLTSIFNNSVVKNKRTGKSYTLVSEKGFEGYGDSIVYTSSYDGLLKPSGEYKSAQILIPSFIRDEKGKLINIRDYTEKVEIDGKTITRLKEDIISKDLLQTNGYRIPTEGYNSMGNFEVVGFLPPMFGDTIIAPHDFIVQAGWDFDADKLYVTQYNIVKIDDKFEILSDKNVQKFIKAQTDEEISEFSSAMMEVWDEQFGYNIDTVTQQLIYENTLLDIERAILSNKEVFKFSISPLTTDGLPFKGKKIDSILHSQYSIDKYATSNDSGIGIGSYATNGTFLSLVANTNIDFAEIESDFTDAAGNELNNPVAINGELKIQNNSQLLSAAVDDVKEPKLGLYNLNTNTFAVSQYLLNRGHSLETIRNFTSHGIIREYLYQMNMLFESNNDEFIADYSLEAQLRLFDGEKESAKKAISTNDLIAKRTTALDKAILNQFLKWEKKARGMNAIKSAINVDSAFLSKSMYENSLKERDVRLLGQNKVLRNATDLIGDMNITGDILNATTIPGIINKYGLYFINDALGAYYNYNNNFYKGITTILESFTTKNKLTPKKKIRLIKDVKEFIYSDAISNILSGDIDTERKRLLEDRTIITKVIQAKKKYPNIEFIQLLNIKTDEKRAGHPPIIQFNNSATVGLDEDRIYRSAISLFFQDDESFEFIQELIKYKLLTENTNSVTSFIKFIPIQYYISTGIAQALSISSQKLSDAQGNEYINRFIHQFLQHAPSYATPINIGNVKNPKRKGKVVISFASEEQQNTNYYSYYDSELSTWRLYKYDLESNEYKLIPLKGYKNIKEYNFNAIDEYNSVYPKNNLTFLENKPKRSPEGNKVSEQGEKVKTKSKTTLPTYSSVYGLGEGKITSNHIIRKISERFPQHKILLELLKELNVNIGVSVDNAMIPNGIYINGEIKINLSKRKTESKFVNTFLEEYIHAGTVPLIRKSYSELKTNEKKYIDQLNGVRTRVLNELKASLGEEAYQEFSKKDPRKDVYNPNDMLFYRATTNEEFIAGVFVDQKFQDKLNTLEFNKVKIIPQRILDIIQEFLNSFKTLSGNKVENDKALAESLKVVLSIIKNKDSQTQIENISSITNHSGGAVGSDTYWEEIGKQYGLNKNNHYFVFGNKTPKGNTSITQDEALEADYHIRRANKTLKRKFPTSNEYVNNLLRRNWWQVKNSDAIYAISTITDNKVNGGTGWAVQMAIDENKLVFVFDQNLDTWFTFSNNEFIKTETPRLTKNFAGIGTREINNSGLEAIKSVFIKTEKEGLLKLNNKLIEEKSDPQLNLFDPIPEKIKNPSIKKIAEEKSESNEEKEIRMYMLAEAINSKFGLKDNNSNIVTFANQNELISKKQEIDLFLQEKNIDLVVIQDKNSLKVVPKNYDPFYAPATEENEFTNFIKKLKDDIVFYDLRINTSGKDVDKLEQRKQETLDQINRLTDEDNLYTVEEVGREQLEYVKKELEKDNKSAQNLVEQKRILSLWRNIADIILDPNLIKDEEYSNTDVVKKLLDIQQEAKRLDEIWLDNARNYTNYYANSESGLGLTYDQMYKMKDGSSVTTDINSAEYLFRDISTFGDPVLFLIQDAINGANNSADNENSEEFRKIDEVFSAYEKTDSYKQDRYFKFLDDKGNLIKRTNTQYYADLNKLRAKYWYSKNNRKPEENQDWKNLINYKKENGIYIDVSKLVEQQENGILKYVENKEYIAELEKEVGFEIDYAIKIQKRKIETYNKLLEAEILTAKAQVSETSETAYMSQWQKKNSPLLALDAYSRDQTRFQELGRTYTYLGAERFVYHIPKKEFNNPKFNELVKDKEAYKVYNYMLEKLSQYYSYAPDAKEEGLSYNFLPNVSMSLIEELTEKGLFNASSGLGKRLFNLIREKDAPLVYESIDRITGEKKYDLRFPISDNTRFLSKDEAELVRKHSSSNLRKILKFVAGKSIVYKHMRDVEDEIKLLQTVMKHQQEITDNDTVLENGLSNKKKAMEYAIVRGFYGTNPEIGFKNIRSKEILDPSEKELKKRLEKKLKEEELTDIERQEIQEVIDNLGSSVTSRKTGKLLMYWTQAVGMGYNIFGPFANLFSGTFGNLIEAAGGESFTTSDLKQAFAIMLNSTKNIIPGATIGGVIGTVLAPGIGTVIGTGLGTMFSLNNTSGTGSKIYNLMNKMKTLGNIIDVNDYERDYNDNTKKWYQKLMPYELYRMSEYFLQGTTMVSLMLNKKVKDKNGNEITLWEAFDSKGNWNEELMGKSEEYQDVEGKGILDFQRKMNRVVAKVHGNYKTSIPIKGSTAGEMFMQYKTWMAETIANRIASSRPDYALGTIERGRWQLYFKRDSKGKIGIDKTNTMYMLKSIIPFVKRGKLDLAAGDMANINRNIMELQLMTSLMLLYFALKFMSDDEEEDYISNFMINGLFRVQSDLGFYANPKAIIESVTEGAIPAMKTIDRSIDFLDTGLAYIIDDDTDDDDFSALGRKAMKLSPAGSITTFTSSMERVTDYGGFKTTDALSDRLSE